MRKDYVRVKKCLFATQGAIDRNQHWNEESRTLGANSRIKGWIGNISQITL